MHSPSLAQLTQSVRLSLQKPACASVAPRLSTKAAVFMLVRAYGRKRRGVRVAAEIGSARAGANGRKTGREVFRVPRGFQVGGWEVEAQDHTRLFVSRGTAHPGKEKKTHISLFGYTRILADGQILL